MSVRSRSSHLNLARIVKLAAACACCLIAAGCTGKGSTTDRIKLAAESTGIKPVTAYPLAGTVTVDNQPAQLKSRKWLLVVMAYDASKPDALPNGPFARVRPDGGFEFTDGGLPPGKYVLLFAALQRSKKKGMTGPDALNNLYNDPDVNAKKPQFVIDHQAPGKKDYSFNLAVAGENPVASAGPKALTKLAD